MACPSTSCFVPARNRSYCPRSYASRTSWMHWRRCNRNRRFRSPLPEVDMNIAQSLFRLAAGAALAVAASTALAAVAGQAAPDFIVTDTQGKPVHLADYRGKFVVLEWTNPECPFVQRHYETHNMPGLQKEFAARDVVW